MHGGSTVLLGGLCCRLKGLGRLCWMLTLTFKAASRTVTNFQNGGFKLQRDAAHCLYSS